MSLFLILFSSLTVRHFEVIWFKICNESNKENVKSYQIDLRIYRTVSNWKSPVVLHRQYRFTGSAGKGVFLPLQDFIIWAFYFRLCFCTFTSQRHYFSMHRTVFLSLSSVTLHSSFYIPICHSRINVAIRRTGR